jgi:hypothetical protein
VAWMLEKILEKMLEKMVEDLRGNLSGISTSDTEYCKKMESSSQKIQDVEVKGTGTFQGGF